MESREIKSPLILKIKPLIEQFLSNNRFELVDIEIRNEKNTPIITIYIFSNDDMSINSLAIINKKITSEVLSSINEEFAIEISSPGINRVLKNIKEFDIFKNKEMKILLDTNESLNVRCNGLISDDKVSLFLLDSDNEINLDIKNIRKAKLTG